MSKQLITAQYEGFCVSCDEEVELGEKVWWEKGIGVWHEKCQEPASARLDRKAKNQAQELGLEPREFGTAPMLREREQ